MLNRFYEDIALKIITPERAKKLLNAVGYDHTHWTRPVMYSECLKLLQPLNIP